MQDNSLGAANQAANPYIRTHTGVKITFLDLRPGMIRKHDLAWHLGRTCRYTALTHQWYSNAEHCLLGMKYCETWEQKRQFLVHDAGEMITGDVPSPFKRLCAGYKEQCNNVQANLNEVLFGRREFDPIISLVDNRLTAAEQKYMRGQPDDDLWVEPYHDVQFQCWTWEAAMLNWIRAFDMYYPEYQY